MRFLLPLVAALALGGCAIIVAPNDGDIRFDSAFSGDTVRGNGQMGSERRAVAGATGIDVSGPVDVEVRIGTAASLEVTGDSNLLSLVRVDMNGDTVRIWADHNLRAGHPLRVKYTVPQLTRIAATGSGHVAVSDLNGAQLTVVKSGSSSLHLSGRVTSLDMQVGGSGYVNATALNAGSASVNLTGSGRLSLGQVRGEALTAHVRGSGEFQANGAVQSVNVHVYGNGGANLVGLAAQQATLSTYGSGDISASVNQSLIAQTSGSGSITVYGNPTHRAVTGRNVQVLN